MDILLPLFRDRLTNLLPEIQGTTILAAFSGGKDSVTLLTLLSALQEELGFTVKAAYLNHGIRKDAPQESRWVSHFCRQQHVPLIMESADAPGLSRREGLNLEAAASRLRYDFLERHIAESPHTWAATGHTLSDQVETFFMRLFRGSGATGLSAIRPIRGGRILRPLAQFTETDIRLYLKRRNLPHYSDPSNMNQRLLRNHLRHQILPRLRRSFPHLDQRIGDTTRILMDEADWFAAHARRILNHVSILENILPPGSLEMLHPAEQRHVVREYLRRLRGDLWGISLANVEALLPGNPSNRHLSLPGITLSRRKGFIFPLGFQAPGYDYALPVSGEFLIPEIAARVGIRPYNRDDNEWDVSGEPTAFQTLVNPKALRFPIRVRAPRPGDCYCKTGTNFRQKVFEMVRSAGLPAPLRALRPLFVDAADQPFWLPGNAVAAHAAPRRGKSGVWIRIDGIWPQPSAS